MANETEQTHVRYVVKYNGRTYEHPLHSNKRYFIRNIADVVNILEYCVNQDLRRNKDTPLCDLYNFNVVRLVNDSEESSIESTSSTFEFNSLLHKVVDRIVDDYTQRYYS